MKKDELAEIIKERLDSLGTFSKPRLLQYTLFFVFCVNCLFLVNQSIQTWQIIYLSSLIAVSVSYLLWFAVKTASEKPNFSAEKLDYDDITHIIWMKMFWQSMKLNVAAVLLRCVWDMLFVG